MSPANDFDISLDLYNHIVTHWYLVDMIVCIVFIINSSSKTNMTKQKYNLKWDTYSDQLQVTMKKLMTSPDFTDVTFVCEDKKVIRAHRNILNECSPTLKALFQIERSLNSIIYLKGINHAEMELILHFIYLGEATFHEDRLNDFLSVARSLEIKGLSEDEETTKTPGINQVPAIDEIINIDNESPDINEIISKAVELSTVDELINNIEKKVPSVDEIPKDVEKSSDQKKNANSSFNETTKEVKNQLENSSKLKEDNDSKTKETLENESPSANSQIENELEEEDKKSIHTPKVFNCEFCPYEATTKRSFELHVQRQHARFHCSRCNYRATSKLHLVTHVKENHEHQKISCDQCEYQTTKQINLINHVKAKHEGIKFSCEYCGKPFSQKYNLASHIKMKHALWLS